MNEPTPEKAALEGDTVDGLRGNPSRCTAKAKTTGSRCKSPAVNGRTKCRMHGGKTPRGPAHPSYKHGRTSKLLGGGLRELYEAALTDPEIAEFRTTLGLLDVRTEQLLERAFKQNGKGVSVAHVGKTWTALEAARATGDEAAEARAFESHAEAVRGAQASDDAWRELREVLNDRRKVSSAMLLAELRGDRAISVERFDFLLTFILDAITRHFADTPDGRKRLRRFSHDLEPIVGEIGKA